MYRAPLFLITGLLLLAALLSLPVRPRRADAQEGGEHAGPQHVRVELDDRLGIATVTVRQIFRNRTGSVATGACLLPLSDEAATRTVRILGEGTPRPNKPGPAARLEGVGPGQYRLLVDRVPAHGQVTAELVYSEVISRRARRRKWIFPVSPPTAEAGVRIGVDVTIRAAAPPQGVSCVAYPLLLSRPEPGVARLSGLAVPATDGRDIVIEYQAPAGSPDTPARLTVVTPTDGQREPYFLLALPPPASLLRGKQRQGRAADIVFVLDASRSTRGRALNVLREAVHDGLADLAPGDRFGVVAFDDDARFFRRSLVPAGPALVSQAIRFLSRIRAGGGSEPERGLQAAAELLAERTEPGRRDAVVAVLCDAGATPSLEAALKSAPAALSGARLTGLSAEADGRLISYRLVRGKLTAGPAVGVSRAAVTYGPALAGARFDPGDLNTAYVYPHPERLPDLPLSSPVLLVGRLEQAPPARGTVGLEGRIEGRTLRVEVPYVSQPAPAGAVEFERALPALWANRRLRRLRQLAGRDGADQEELLAAATAVRTEHAIAAEPVR